MWSVNIINETKKDRKKTLQEGSHLKPESQQLLAQHTFSQVKFLQRNIVLQLSETKQQKCVQWQILL